MCKSASNWRQMDDNMTMSGVSCRDIHCNLSSAAVIAAIVGGERPIALFPVWWTRCSKILKIK